MNQMVKDGVAKFEGYDIIIMDPADRPKKESGELRLSAN